MKLKNNFFLDRQILKNNKYVFLSAATLLFLIVFLSPTYAYPYYYTYQDGGFNSYSFESHRASGSYGAPIIRSSNYFDSKSSYRYLPGGGYEKKYTFTYVSRQFPGHYPFYHRHYYHYYPRNYYIYYSYPRYY